MSTSLDTRAYTQPMRTLWVLAGIIGTLGITAPVAASPPGPSYNHTADCAGITITTAGWPDGSYGILGVNGDPPAAIPLNTTHSWPTSGSYTFTVYFQVPGQVPMSEIEHHDCDAPPDTVAVEPAAPVAAVKSQPRVKVDTFTGRWKSVRLAPPW